MSQCTSGKRARAGCFDTLRAVARAGTNFAVFGLMSSLVSGCLILEPIEFDDRQLPSYLEPIEPYSFSRAPDTPETSDQNCESGDPGMLFRANVSDPNTTE